MRRLIFALPFALLVSALIAGEKKEEKKEDKDKLEVPAGFKIDIFAAAPDIDSVVSVAATPTGETVFVCQDPLNVRCNESNTARIVRLVDTDGDGKADKITVFADKVNAARGLIYVDGTLYAMQQPFLTAYRDEDGDGVAEIKKVLVEGIGPKPEKVPPDHAVNGPRAAIDGWIYIACGDQGVPNAKGSDGSTIQLLGGGVVRVRFDGSDLEVYARGLRNCYDVGIDPFFNMFVRDNTNDGGGWDVRFAQVFQTGSYGYPSLFKNYADEIIQPEAIYGGGSGAGGMWIQEPAFPEGYNNTLYTGDWGRNRIYSFKLEPNGSGFKPTQEDFLKGGRPVDMDCDAAGHIFVADWTIARNPYGANKGPSGRVVRITPEANKAKPYPDVAKASDAELVQFVTHESQTLRIHAQQILLKRGKKPETLAALEKIAGGDAPLFARVAAIFTLKQLAGSESHDAILKLTSKPELREFCLRALTDRKKELGNVTAAPFVEALKDANPRVRLAACIALSRLGKVDTAAALLPVTTDSDAVVAHAAFQALRELKAADACVEVLGKSPELTAGAFRALRGIHTVGAVNALKTRFAQEKDEALKHEIIRTLGRLHYIEGEWDGSWFGIRPDTRGPYFKNGTWEGSESIAAFLNTHLTGGNETEKMTVLESMAKFQILTPELLNGLTKAAESGGKLQAEAVKIIVQMKQLNEDALSVLEKLALTETADAALRSEAVLAFERIQGKAKLPALLKLLPKLEPHRDLNVSAHAVLLKSAKDPIAKEEIEKAWKDDKRLPVLVEAIGRAQTQDMAAKVREHLKDTRADVRLAAINASAALQDGAAIMTLLDHVEKDVERAASARALVKITARKAPFTELVPHGEKAIAAAKALPAGTDAAVIKDVFDFTRALCGETRIPDADRKRLQAAIPKPPTAGGASAGPRIADLKEGEAMEKVMKIAGNAEAGKPLFTKLTCINCHALSTDEKPKGPYLGDIGVRYQKAQLAASVFTPSAVITQGYETVLITLESGERVEGFVASDSGEQLELRNVQGEPKVIQKKSIKNRKETKHSVMPDGLMDNSTLEEFANLLAYLESLKGAKK